MDFEDIKSLIMIRDYIQKYVERPKVDNRIVNYLNNCALLIDRKIITHLNSPEFKKLINYEGAPDLTVNLNNLK